MRSRKTPQVLSDAVAELYRPVRLDEFGQTVMRVLRMLIDSDINSYTQVNLNTGHIVGVLDVPAMDEREASERMGKFVNEHPLVQHFARTGSTQAHQITDFLTQRRFESLGLYNELYRLMSVRKQMAISITGGDGTVLGAIVNRASRDFSAHDRAVLNLLGKHLSQAYANAVQLTQLQDQQDAQAVAMQHAGLGLAIVDGGARLVWQSDRAAALLDGLGGRSGGSGVLPEVVRRWFAHLLSTPPERRNGEGRLLMPHADASGVTIIRYAGSPRPGRHVLLLQSDPSSIPATPLIAAGLTPREAEVLQWVAQGKTNADIAGILGASPRTVQKHVERILQKLHVETRAAAVARAREL